MHAACAEVGRPRPPRRTRRARPRLDASHALEASWKTARAAVSVTAQNARRDARCRERQAAARIPPRLDSTRKGRRRRRRRCAAARSRPKSGENSSAQPASESRAPPHRPPRRAAREAARAALAARWTSHIGLSTAQRRRKRAAAMRGPRARRARPDPSPPPRSRSRRAARRQSAPYTRHGSSCGPQVRLRRRRLMPDHLLGPPCGPLRSFGARVGNLVAFLNGASSCWFVVLLTLDVIETQERPTIAPSRPHRRTPSSGDAMIGLRPHSSTNQTSVAEQLADSVRALWSQPTGGCAYAVVSRGHTPFMGDTAILQNCGGGRAPAPLSSGRASRRGPGTSSCRAARTSSLRRQWTCRDCTNSFAAPTSRRHTTSRCALAPPRARCCC